MIVEKILGFKPGDEGLTASEDHQLADTINFLNTN